MLFGLGFLALLVLGSVVLYNSLVRLRVLVDNAWADIEVQLKRRHDLIPNLIETVKGYAAHERVTFEAVVEARNAAIAARGPRAQGDAERGLAAALGGLFALAESYPQLRATENFAHLQGSLANIEEAVQSARRYYNAVVRDFNTRIAQIPWNLMAGILGYSAHEFYQITDEAERAVPQVRF